jgi:DNA (cytosine-5)-methyltransferase 1
MDPTQLTHISLCSGYGGIDLGLRRVLPSLRTIAYSEIEEYACGLLAARMERGQLDPAPIWTDLKTFPFREFYGCVDILSGGYPCQPFSAAGKRLGKDDPRHLWPFIADGIRVCRPRICFFENVEGHITLGLRDVLGDLGRLGYAATWGIFSASEVGAPHQRKRVFLLAHNANDRFKQPLLDGKSIESTQGHSIAGGNLSRVADAAGNDTKCPAGAGPGSHKAGRAWTSGQFAGSDGDLWPARPGEPQHAWEPPRVVANPNRRGLEGAGAQRGRTEDAVGSDRESSEVVADFSVIDGQRGSARTGRRSGSEIDVTGGDEEQQQQAESQVGGDSDGPGGGLDDAQLCISGDNRTDELRLLGNGVVPATAALAFRTLLTQLDHDLR